MKLIDWIKTLPEQRRNKSYTLHWILPSGGIGFAGLGKVVHEAIFGKPPTPPEPEELPPVQHVLSLHYAVCPTCDGKGSHVNPSIDAHGITAEEWDRDWDEEDRENYQSGLYDVVCYECKGRTTVLTIDERNSSSEAVKAAHEFFEDDANHRREVAAERRMGA
jgi:hypothetical protein